MECGNIVPPIIYVREQLTAEWTEDLDGFISANKQISQSYHDRLVDTRNAEDKESSLLQTAYEQNTMAVENLGVFGANASLPLRKGNFDLTILLVTQESVHRVLRQYREDDEKVAFEWLLEFYSERVPKIL